MTTQCTSLAFVCDFLIATDKLIGCLLDTLAKAGKLDSTVIVVTSDHGMASQSPTTSGGIYRALPKAGVSYTSPGNLFIYLKCLDLRTSVKHLKGGSTTKLVVTVSDDDHDKTGKRPPSIGATVTVHVDGKVVTGVTNFLGKATLYIKPTKGTKSVSILASHGGFNEAAKTLPVK